MLKIGIEHEFVFQDTNGVYLDFENAAYETFQKIVDAFPHFEQDTAFFDCKSLEKQPKRCYVEGFERYSENGELLETVPKGLEIRTLPHFSIDDVVKEFADSYLKVMEIASTFGLSPLLTSYHPFKTTVDFASPLNKKELSLRSEEWLEVAFNSMLLHGIQINVSLPQGSKEELIDLLNKVNYYMPFIIPFAFSSPFSKSGTFEGLSYRTYFRSGTRHLARIQKRKGVDVIEFAGLDACGDIQLLRALLLLYEGLLLDRSLNKRAELHNREVVKLSALKGFSDAKIKEGGVQVLEAVKEHFAQEPELWHMLYKMLEKNDSYAARMKLAYAQNGSIMECISNQYAYI